MNKNYYSPLPESTKYQFGITNSSYDGLEMIEVFRKGKNFYLQQVEEETELLGDIRDLGRYLYENNAEWLVERKKKLRRRILFLNKQQALELLRDGVPVFHLDSDQIFSYSEDYEELLSSVTGKISELLPGIYMAAIGEPYNEKTYKEVQKENEAARRLRRKFASRAKAMATTPQVENRTETTTLDIKCEEEEHQRQEARQLEEERQAALAAANAPKKKGTPWWKIAAAVFGGAVLLGGGLYCVTKK